MNCDHNEMIEVKKVNGAFTKAGFTPEVRVWEEEDEDDEDCHEDSDPRRER